MNEHIRKCNQFKVNKLQDRKIREWDCWKVSVARLYPFMPHKK